MINNGTILIETDRFILRKFKHTDSKAMFKNWGSDDNVTKFLSWQTHKNVKDSEEIINKWVAEYEDKSIYNWAIELKYIKEAIGGISIVKLEYKHSACEIGYCISSKYWNKGITTEALKAIIKFLFQEVSMNRISAKHDTNNLPSGQVMRKSGMVYEGTLREIKIRNDEFYSLAVYSILKKEWIDNNE